MNRISKVKKMRKDKFRYGFGLVLMLVIFQTSISYAQYEEYDRGQKLKYLDLGIKQYDAGRYEDAEKSFKQVLETVKVLPAEICFYFGANSFYLKKYKQSINWLNKYIALKGTTGQYFDECTLFLEKAQERYLLASADDDDEIYEPGEARDYTVMPRIDCGPSGKVVCPVCKGETVIIKRSAMSLDYRSCPWCDNHGNLSCDEYNLLIQGELKPKSERVAN